MKVKIHIAVQCCEQAKQSNTQSKQDNINMLKVTRCQEPPESTGLPLPLLLRLTRSFSNHISRLKIMARNSPKIEDINISHRYISLNKSPEFRLQIRWSQAKWFPGPAPLYQCWELLPRPSPPCSAPENQWFCRPEFWSWHWFVGHKKNQNLDSPHLFSARKHKETKRWLGAQLKQSGCNRLQQFKKPTVPSNWDGHRIMLRFHLDGCTSKLATVGGDPWSCTNTFATFGTVETQRQYYWNQNFAKAPKSIVCPHMATPNMAVQFQTNTKHQWYLVPTSKRKNFSSRHPLVTGSWTDQSKYQGNFSFGCLEGVK